MTGDWTSSFLAMPLSSLHRSVSSLCLGKLTLVDCTTRTPFLSVFILDLANGGINEILEGWKRKRSGYSYPMPCALAVVVSFQVVTTSRLPSYMPPALIRLLWKCHLFLLSLHSYQEYYLFIVASASMFCHLICSLTLSTIW